jgi:hypothetical protein
MSIQLTKWKRLCTTGLSENRKSQKIEKLVVSGVGARSAGTAVFADAEGRFLTAAAVMWSTIT